jgi:hypothetical protein
LSIVNGYATLAEAKAELGIATAETTDDTKIELAVEAASRWLDDACGWRFYTTGTDESRTYTAEHAGRLDVPEGILSLTTLACDQDGDRVYEETWATTDYDLTPDNAVLDGRPYTGIHVAPLGRYGFSKWRKGVKLTGKFGYAATAPKPIKRACVLKAQQLFMRKDMPFGVMSASAVGTVTMRILEDADILALVRQYVRSIN